MIRAALTLLAVLASSTALADVPLSRAASGQLTAPVRIGGGAATPFVVDTAAEGCRVTQHFATQRHLLRIGGEDETSAVLAPDVKIDGQALGALRCKVMLNGSEDQADGVIGADALARFVVRYDARRMRLSLHGGAQHGQALVSPRARLVDAQRLPDGQLSVPVRLNNAVGAGVVATGARRSVVNTRFAAASGAGVEAVRSMQKVQGAFALAGTVTPAIDSGVADLPAFAANGLRDQPAMLLGLDRLQGLTLVIDYPRRRIWFDPG